MYTCHACLFNSTKKSEYTRHIKTKKHLKNTLNNPVPDNELFKCEYCEMSYKSRQGLHTHMKKIIKM